MPALQMCSLLCKMTNIGFFCSERKFVCDRAAANTAAGPSMQSPAVIAEEVRSIVTGDTLPCACAKYHAHADELHMHGFKHWHSERINCV